MPDEILPVHEEPAPLHTPAYPQREAEVEQEVVSPSWEAPSVNFYTPPPVDTASTPSYQATRGEVQRVAEAITAEVHKAVVGQDETIENALAGLLADGHVLLEGVPGTAKTLLVRALAAAVSGERQRTAAKGKDGLREIGCRA